MSGSLALSELKNKGIVTINTLLTPQSIDEEIKNNELLANVFARVIENNRYYSEIPIKSKDQNTGKYHKEIKKWINISGWSFIDRVLKITPHIIKSEMKLVKREKRAEKIEYCCTCELRTLEGLVIATGIGKANSGEEYKEGYTEAKLESLAQSRSISKTHRLYFQDILEVLNLNNDIIIEGDFVQKKDDKDTINNHYNKVKNAISKPSFDHPGDPESADKIEEIQSKYNAKKEEDAKKDASNSKKSTMKTGIISKNKPDKEKTALEKAIEDKEKRDKEKTEPNEGFKTADKVENPPEDAEVLSHIKAIIISLREDEKEINETNIKLHLAERLKAEAITKEQCDEVIDKLAKMSLEELVNL